MSRATGRSPVVGWPKSVCCCSPGVTGRTAVTSGRGRPVRTFPKPRRRPNSALVDGVHPGVSADPVVVSGHRGVRHAERAVHRDRCGAAAGPRGAGAHRARPRARAATGGAGVRRPAHDGVGGGGCGVHGRGPACRARDRPGGGDRLRVGPSPVAGQSASPGAPTTIALRAALVVASFWAATFYAHGLGQRAARVTEANPAGLPVVTVLAVRVEIAAPVPQDS
jgi:hypothetical protein